MYVVGVAKKFLNSNVKGHRKDTKRYWHVFYYDEKGKFNAKRISAFKVPLYRAQIRRVVTVTCDNCQREFKAVGIEGNKDIALAIICPWCGVGHAVLE